MMSVYYRLQYTDVIMSANTICVNLCRLEVAVIHSSAPSGLVSQLLLKGYQVGIAYCWGCQCCKRQKSLARRAMSNLLTVDKIMASLTPSSLEFQFDQLSVTLKRQGCRLWQASYRIEREGIYHKELPNSVSSQTKTSLPLQMCFTDAFCSVFNVSSGCLRHFKAYEIALPNWASIALHANVTSEYVRDFTDMNEIQMDHRHSGNFTRMRRQW